MMRAFPVSLFFVAACLSPLVALSADEPPATADSGQPVATHVEIEPLKVEFKSLSAFRLDAAGNLLACDAEARHVKVIDPAGKVSRTIDLPFGPEAIDAADDGSIYCGGQGQLAKLSKEGKLLKTADLPQRQPGPPAEPLKGGNRPQRVSGIAVSQKDLFVAYGAGWSMRSLSRLIRFDRDLENPKLLAEGLRGCCQRCDIVAREGVAYVAENTAHRVVAFDCEGNQVAKWGERGRTGLEGFGSCCNPMNLAFDGKGTLYTAESGLGRVKRYTTDGKLLGLVAYVDVERFEQAGALAASCSNIAIAVTPDGKTIYVMDYKQNRIRVLQEKK